MSKKALTVLIVSFIAIAAAAGVVLAVMNRKPAAPSASANGSSSFNGAETTRTENETSLEPNAETPAEKATENATNASVRLSYQMKKFQYEHRTSGGSLYLTHEMTYPYFTGSSSLEATLNAEYSRMIQSLKNYEGDVDEDYQIQKEIETEYGLASSLPFYENFGAEVTYNENGYISIEKYQTDWTGGGHPYTYPSAETYQIETGKEQKYTDFFLGTEAAVFDLLRAEFKKVATDQSLLQDNASFQDLLASTPFSLTKKGLCFHYYAGGAVPNVEVVIPYTSSMAPFIQVG